MIPEIITPCAIEYNVPETGIVLGANAAISWKMIATIDAPTIVIACGTDNENAKPSYLSPLICS